MAEHVQGPLRCLRCLRWEQGGKSTGVEQAQAQTRARGHMNGGRLAGIPCKEQLGDYPSQKRALGDAGLGK